ncbi:Asp-tRNA(Asn)/Glu-tRNA(Gln) amidotransferase subunit GatC [Candidatus Peregrinibacteria bacterium]|nr:Asp-tRNA(Asn)/Glu-tRNA(Gln) amidotransferase subunit GatC [Candidatus Peregrinibacteria bacterium]
MPSLTKDHVRHIAKLARLKLSEEEVEKFTTELTSILRYVDMLQEVDTSSVPPTAHVTGLSTVLRDDTLTQSPISPEDLLACSPLPVSERQIVTPSAHE